MEEILRNKTLIITPFFKPNLGGVETFSEDLAKALAKKYDVHICTIKWSKPVQWEGLPVFKSIVMIIKLNYSLIKMLKKYEYSKVYAMGLMACIVCLLNRIKFNAIICTLYDFKKHNKIFRSIMNKADKIFVEGNNGKKDLISKGIKKELIVTFHHWCDQTQFNYVLRVNKHLKVLFIGRPIKIKGKHIIQECEKITKDIDYEYVESVPFSDLPKHYQMADVVVIPSLYSESFSRVVVEAASCGCLVITSNKGSLPEQVRDFGWTIEPTPENFAKILDGLKDNKLFLENKQVNTALYANKYFNEKNAEVFL